MAEFLYQLIHIIFVNGIAISDVVSFIVKLSPVFNDL